MLRVTKNGGVVVWVVGDRINGGRSMTSFRQAVMFQDIGFTVHDVMIYQKRNTPFPRSNAYTNAWEFMLVLSKNGPPKTFNPLKVPTVRHGEELLTHNKLPDIAHVNVKIVVDHDQETGMPRGIICDSCNTGLGRFKNGENLLEDAMEYLRRHEEK